MLYHYAGPVIVELQNFFEGLSITTVHSWTHTSQLIHSITGPESALQMPEELLLSYQLQFRRSPCHLSRQASSFMGSYPILSRGNGKNEPCWTSASNRMVAVIGLQSQTTKCPRVALSLDNYPAGEIAASAGAPAFLPVPASTILRARLVASWLHSLISYTHDFPKPTKNSPNLQQQVRQRLPPRTS